MKQNSLILIIVVSIIVIIFFLMLLMKVKVNIYKRGSGYGIIKVKLWFLNIKSIDIGQSFSKMLETHLMSSNIKNGINNLRIFIDNNFLIKEFISNITVKKIVFIPKYNTSSPILMPYISVFNWSIIGMVKRLINNYFLRVKNEYYQIYLDDETKKGIDLELELQIELWRIIKVSLGNIKPLTTMIKRLKKESKMYGNYETTSE